MKNILLITADDLNWNSLGVWGCSVGATPNLDRFASESVRFENGHVAIAVCQPSRGALATGRYPHHQSVEGFYHIGPEIPTLPDCLQQAGYVCGILGKYDHSTPCLDFAWDHLQDFDKLGYGRDPSRYREEAEAFFARAKEEGRPFYLMANSHDPHRPFHGSDQEKQMWPDAYAGLTSPSQVFAPEEVEVPGFLPDLPDVRREIAEYFSSARRLDDTVGEILSALTESGLAEDTLVVFLSDNGMALPYAKTNCYLHSTKSPWIVRLPGVTEAGRVESQFISGIDFMPTVLDWIGHVCPDGVDGKSFMPLLRGEEQAGRQVVFTEFHETAMRNRYPMRCVQDRKFGYIFNAWSDGKRAFSNESQVGRTWKAMCEVAETDKVVRKRVEFYSHRTLEELYDFETDPDALHNLIDEPAYREVADRMRALMGAWMREHDDCCAAVFDCRHDPDQMARFMREQQAIAGVRSGGDR